MAISQGRTGLVLSGGGARGAYQVGVLKALAELAPGPVPFGVITGVSVGAINAAVIAEGADDFAGAAAKLEQLWRSLSSSDIFCTDVSAMFQQMAGWVGAATLGWAGVEPPLSFLNAAPLEALLTREIDFGRIDAMLRNGPLCAFAVTASSYTSGHSTTFFAGVGPQGAWQRSRRLGQETSIRVEHILASSALPGVFQARRIDDEWYGDGALRQLAPLSPAVHLGCDRMLMIAARDGTPDYEPLLIENEEYPSLGIISGQLLDIVFNDNLDADLERLHRINETLGKMLPERRAETGLHEVRTLMIRPSEDIRFIAGAHVDEAPWTVKTLLGLLGAQKPPWVLPSYLTFENGYISALIDLGYRDTIAQNEALRGLLAP
ncbi:MAG: patatin-like phospholipase family protein [Pseudomonadota bacterium]